MTTVIRDRYPSMLISLSRKVLLAAALMALLIGSTAIAQWEPEVKLSTSEGAASLNENMGRCIVADAGMVHAVWSSQKDNARAVYYRRSEDSGKTWSPAMRVSGESSSDSFPLLAESAGTVHLVYLRGFGTPDAASYYRRSNDGGKTWDKEVLLGKTKWWAGVAAAGDMVYVSLNTLSPDDAKNSVVYFRRSADRGVTWEPTQQISTAAPRVGGRAEDPGIMADGSHVYLVWNDNRDAEAGKGMSVYFRYSADSGKTWGTETALTHAPQYTYFPTISVNGANLDLCYGDRQPGQYDIFYMRSSDFGATWTAARRLALDPGERFYPSVVRDGSNVHVVWMSKDGITYQHSGDSGATWERAVDLAKKGVSPFVTVGGDTVHVIFASQRDGSSGLYYIRNSTANVPAR